MDRKPYPLVVSGILVFVCLLGWYLPAFYLPVFHADDITVFWHHLNWGAWRSNGGWVGNGRFLQWLIHATAMEWIHSLEDYVILRWLGLLFGLFFGTVFLNRFTAQGRWKPALLLLLLFISPSFAVYFIQTHFVDILLAGGFSMLAGAAFLILWETGKRPVWHIFTGLAFAWISLHLHQAGIGFFWIPFLCRFGSGSYTDAKANVQVRYWAYAGAVYIGICAVYWVYYNLLMGWLLPDSFLTERGGVPVGLDKRPHILVYDYLHSALGGYQLFPLRGIPVITSLLSLVLCLLSWNWLISGKARGWSRVFLWLTLPAVLVLPIAPALASHLLFFAYRLSGPLSGMVIILVFLGGVHAWSRRESKLRWPLTGLFVIWGLLYFGPSRWAVQTGLIRAQAEEYQALSDLFDSEPLYNVSMEWAVLRPLAHDSHPGMRQKMEYGLYNTTEHFAIENYFQIMVERYWAYAGWNFTFNIEEPGQSWPDYPWPLISMDFLLDPESPKNKHLHNTSAAVVPGFGTVYQTGENRYFSPWLGRLEYLDFNKWKHEELVTVSVTRSSETGLWADSTEFGPLWINPRWYPAVKLMETDEWTRIEK